MGDIMTKKGKLVKWFILGQRQLLEELTEKFNALPTDTRIELLRLCPDLAISLSRVVRYHESIRMMYEKKEGRRR